MNWWREAVGYHVYLRGYRDSDDDGIGDLPGLLSRLDHPRDLGVDAVWVSPFYPSPQADSGYDISDHRAVDPLYGTMSDVDSLIQAAQRMGLRLIADVVPNHTSADHPWFRAALNGGPERARYHFRTEPNGWESMFGGPAWTQAPDGQWYLHLFSPQQPDLNWTDPEVADDFDSTLRFWLDRGFAGVRIDVAGGLAKDPDYAEVDAQAIHPHWDRPETEAIHRRWRAVLDSYGERVAIGELWGAPDRIASRVSPGRLHQVFQFDWAVAPWESLQDTATQAIEALGKVGALPTWVLGSHDLPRVASRYGLRRALAKALVTFALPGSTWIYQGEELGMENVEVDNGDPGGRDGFRQPMPWDSLPVEPLTMYRQAIALRKRFIVGQPFEWLPERPDVLAFRRGDVACVLNTGRQAVPFPGYPLHQSGPLDGDLLPPDTAVWTVLGTSTSASSLPEDQQPE